jgi:hypothetical protein
VGPTHREAVEVVAAVVAGLFVMVATFFGWQLSERSQERREKTAAAHRRSDVQRTTLLELRDALGRVVRETGRAIAEESEAIEAHPERPWGSSESISIATAEAQQEAYSEVCRVAPFVDDERIRQEADSIAHTAFDLIGRARILGLSERTAIECGNELANRLVALYGLIGEIVRVLP